MQADNTRIVVLGTGGTIAGRATSATDNVGYRAAEVGVAALPEDVDGTVVLLGDMPKVDSGLIDRLIQAFNPVEGRGIVVPVSGGRRGNPVLWGRAYFGAVQGLAGDVGAKHLIGENEAAVVEVDADEGALIDVDTPEALKQLVGAGA